MCHGPTDRDIKHLTGKHSCRSDSASDISSSGAINCSIHIMGTACTKIRNCTSLCRTYDTSCFCCDQRLMIDLCKQCCYLLCFNDRYKLLRCELIAQGIHNAVSINQKKIVERAALSKCSRVVIAHNHPGGVALPSDEDVRSTLQIHNTLKALHIQLVDHIIVSGDDYISLADSNIFVAL